MRPSSGHEPMVLSPKAFGHKRLGASRIMLTQKKFTLSMNSILYRKR